jgi:site-specific DNA-methyltransferase (adenine-specific)
LIIDDPPYGATELGWDKAPDWDKLASLYHNVLKDNGLVYIFGKQPSLIEVYNNFSKLFDFRFELIWNRNNVPWSSNFKPLPTHENIFVFCKKGTTVESTKFYIKNVMTEGKPYSKLRKRKSPTHSYYQDTYLAETGAKRYPKSILEIPPPIGSIPEYVGFPTQKPLELIRWILLASTRRDDIVLDPHAGSGTTLLAALLLRRKSIGIELHEEAYNIASERILDAIEKIPQDQIL